MSNTEHLIWLVVAAVVVTAVLVVGTLAAADLLPRRTRETPPDADRSEDEARDRATAGTPPGVTSGRR